MSDTAVALELRGITKRFGGLSALRDASFAARPGTVHALLGENGAGKTTLMRVAYGFLRPDAGTVLVAGAPRAFSSPADAIAAGIGMVQQHYALVPAMTVAENVALAARAGWRYDAATSARQLTALGAHAGLALDPAARAGELSVTGQQRLEIIKALSRDAKILILDEPTAVLAPAESAELLRWLRAFANAGHTVVLITHKLREALAFADDVTVLRRGETVLRAPARDLDEARLTRAMLGEGAEIERDATFAAPSLPVTGGGVVEARDLELRDEAGHQRIAGASFVVRAGEIVGVAGVEGSGHHALLRALGGRLAPARGVLLLPPTIGYIPEDRHRDAVVLDFSLTENVALRGAGARRGRMSWKAIARLTAGLLDAFDVRASGPGAAMRTLSGGNQQKLVVARELHDQPALVVAENPTRGLDVRAAAAVRDRLRAACDAGSAVVVYSSDLDEVLALGSRVLAAHAGRVTALPPERELVGRAMLGAG